MPRGRRLNEPPLRLLRYSTGQDTGDLLELSAVKQVMYKCSNFNSYKPFRSIVEIILRSLDIKPGHSLKTRPSANRHGPTPSGWERTHGLSDSDSLCDSDTDSDSDESGTGAFGSSDVANIIRRKIQAAYRCLRGMSVESSRVLQAIGSVLQSRTEDPVSDQVQF